MTWLQVLVERLQSCSQREAPAEGLLSAEDEVAEVQKHTEEYRRSTCGSSKSTGNDATSAISKTVQNFLSESSTSSAAPDAALHVRVARHPHPSDLACCLSGTSVTLGLEPLQDGASLTALCHRRFVYKCTQDLPLLRAGDLQMRANPRVDDTGRDRIPELFLSNSKHNHDATKASKSYPEAQQIITTKSSTSAR